METVTSGLSGTCYRVGPALSRMGDGLYRGYAGSQEVVLRLARRNTPPARALRAEAAALLSVSHPRIVTVQDRGRTNEHVFLVLEGPAEQPLAELIAQSDLALPAALDLALQVLEVLEALHGAGVAWGWLRPGAFWIDRAGRIKLFDLRGAGSTDPPVPLTIAEAVYLAPEVGGGSLTPAADLYAWGALVFELLSGRPPFIGSSPTELAIKHLSEAPPDLEELHPQTPADLSAIIARCLAKRPDDRPASAQVVRAAVEPVYQRLLAEAQAKMVACPRCQARVPPTERCPLCNAQLANVSPPPPARKRRLPPLLGLGAALALLIMLFATPDGNDQPAKAAATPPAAATAERRAAAAAPSAVPTARPTATAAPLPRGALLLPPGDVTEPAVDLIYSQVSEAAQRVTADLEVAGTIARRRNEATYQVYLELDGDPQTGDRSTPWRTLGADVTILYRSGEEGAQVLRWRDSAWEGIGAAQVSIDGGKLALSFPAEWLDGSATRQYTVLTRYPTRNLADYGPDRTAQPAEAGQDEH